MLFKSVYRSYIPTCYYVFIFYTTMYNYANVCYFYGLIVPEVNYSILFYVGSSDNVCIQSMSITLNRSMLDKGRHNILKLDQNIQK